MARPKEFDRQNALGKAMEVFWTQGYEATSMTDLRLAMGIGRQSLYDTFGDKETLFTEALDRYISFNDGSVTALLGNADPIAGIRAFFDARVRLLSSGFRRGCLMFNSCVEVSPHDSAVASRIHSGLGTMQQSLEKALRRAAEKDQIPGDAKVGDLAAFLTTQVAGMAVMAKNQSSAEELQAVADLAVAALC